MSISKYYRVSTLAYAKTLNETATGQFTGGRFLCRVSVAWYTWANTHRLLCHAVRPCRTA